MDALVVTEEGEIVDGPVWADREEWIAAGRDLVVTAERSMWNLGEWWRFGSGRNYGSGQAVATEIGVDYQTISNAASVCKAFEFSRRRENLSFGHHAEVAALPPAEQDTWLDKAEAEGLSQKALRREIKESDPDRNQWFTPPWLFDQLALTFDMDVAAPRNPAHRTVPARAYFTEDDDGLAQTWDGLVWCNPPYSDAAPWADRMAAHGNGLLLTHFSFKAEWMVRALHAPDALILFVGMSFVRPDGKEQMPTYGLVLGAYGATACEALGRVSNEWASPIFREGV